MKILISANMLLDAALSPVPDAAFCLGQLIADDHDIAVVLKELDVYQVVMRGKALREHFPMLPSKQVLITADFHRLDGDIVVSADSEDFGESRKLNILFEDWHNVCAQIGIFELEQKTTQREQSPNLPKRAKARRWLKRIARAQIAV